MNTGAVWNCCTLMVFLYNKRKLMTDSCADVCRCDGCGAVFHAECRQKAQPCPRCVRRELHHTRPSSFWSPDDDSPGCFYLPYQDTWDAGALKGAARPPCWTKCLFFWFVRDSRTKFCDRGWAQSVWCVWAKPLSYCKEQGKKQLLHQALQTEILVSVL